MYRPVNKKLRFMVDPFDTFLLQPEQVIRPCDSPNAISLTGYTKQRLNAPNHPRIIAMNGD